MNTYIKKTVIHKIKLLCGFQSVESSSQMYSSPLVTSVQHGFDFMLHTTRFSPRVTESVLLLKRLDDEQSEGRNVFNLRKIKIFLLFLNLLIIFEQAGRDVD